MVGTNREPPMSQKEVVIASAARTPIIAVAIIRFIRARATAPPRGYY